jgi:hypothetical protein
MRSENANALLRSTSRFSTEIVRDERASIPLSVSFHRRDSFNAAEHSPMRSLYAAYASYMRNRCTYTGQRSYLTATVLTDKFIKDLGHVQSQLRICHERSRSHQAWLTDINGMPVESVPAHTNRRLGWRRLHAVPSNMS